MMQAKASDIFLSSFQSRYQIGISLGCTTLECLVLKLLTSRDLGGGSVLESWAWVWILGTHQGLSGCGQSPEILALRGRNGILWIIWPTRTTIGQGLGSTERPCLSESSEVGKMTQWLRAHTAFPEDPSSPPGTHIRWFTSNSSSRVAGHPLSSSTSKCTYAHIPITYSVSLIPRGLWSAVRNKPGQGE